MKNNKALKCLTSSEKNSLKYLNDSTLTAKIEQLDEDLTALNEYAKYTSHEKAQAIQEMVNNIKSATETFLLKKTEALKSAREVLSISSKRAAELYFERRKGENPKALLENLACFTKACDKEMEEVLKTYGIPEKSKKKFLAQFSEQCKTVIEKNSNEYKKLYEKNKDIGYANAIDVSCREIREKQSAVLKDVLKSVDSTATTAFDRSCQNAHTSKQPKLAEHTDSTLTRLIGHVVLAITAIISVPLKWAIDYKKTGGEWTWPFFTMNKTVTERKAERVINSVNAISKMTGPS